MRLEDWQKYIESQFLDNRLSAEQKSTESKTKEESESSAQTADAEIGLESDADATEIALHHKPESPQTYQETPPAPPLSIDNAPVVSDPQETGDDSVADLASPQFSASSNGPTRRDSAVVSSARVASPVPVRDLGLTSDEEELPDFEKYFPAFRQNKSDSGTGSAERKPTARSVTAVSPPETQSDTSELALEEDRSVTPDGSATGASTLTSAEYAAPQDNEETAPHVRRVPARRARHARNVRPENVPAGLSATELWAAVPRHVQTLLALGRIEEKEVAQYSYKRPFEEKRSELIERLLDPILSLEDTARLLNVCPTTVRRYTNKGILSYYRKEPDKPTKDSAASDKETRQRRFRLSDILAFLEAQQSAIEADQQAERRKSGQIAAGSLFDNGEASAHPNGQDT